LNIFHLANRLSQVEKPSGFADTSALSPFGTLASPKSPSTGKQTSEPEAASKEKKQTSSSAFASSGLSAFSNSAKSPFGGLATPSGQNSGAGFGSFGPKPSSSLGSSSGFAGASPFAAKTASGFGSVGGAGFGSALGSGFGGVKAGMSSFAPSGGSIGVLGSGSLPKPFGKTEDDEEDEGENDMASPKEDDKANERDSRFYEQQSALPINNPHANNADPDPAETGEEAEDTVFSCRAKLFHFEKEWKERGVGTVKLNIHYTLKEDPEEAPEQKARLIMRTDGVHRVVLNTPIFKGMKFGTPDGQEPAGKTLNLTGMENGKLALFLLRVSSLLCHPLLP
jgi:Ran-binding protein 3